MKTLALSLMLLMQQALPSNGLVSGRILSVDGSPAVGVRVMVMAPNTTALAPTVLEAITQTDAEGRYRLERIPPGRYIVGAGLVNSPSYYPGVKGAADARVVVVTAGQPIEGIDFSLPAVMPTTSAGHYPNVLDLVKILPGYRANVMAPAAPVSGSTTGVSVSGRAVDARGNPMIGRKGGSPVIGQVGLSGSTGKFETSIAADGTFEFKDIPPGMYDLQVLPWESSTKLNLVAIRTKQNATGLVVAAPKLSPVD